MPDTKTAGSIQGAWALLAQGVAAARLDAIRLGHLMERATTIVDKSSEKEHLYEVAGDIIKAAPERLERITANLDRLSYALSLMGEQHLREQLPLSDRLDVDEAMFRSPPLRLSAEAPSAERVVLAYLAKKADLHPAIGFPGGPCHLTERIQDEVRNPRTKEYLTEKVETGQKLSPREEGAIYDKHPERGAGIFKSMVLVPHAQGRMDWRGVTVPEIRLALKSWSQAYTRGKSLANNQSVKKPALRVLAGLYRQWEASIKSHDSIAWTDPTIKLKIVFKAEGPRALVITAFWEGLSDPRPPGDSCPT